MNYREAKEFIDNMYEKKGSVLLLDHIRNLMNELDNVQNKLKIIHIAGTNGKGSTAAYISQVLIQAGYKVGKYTSPAVFEYLEIFSVNNVKMKEEEYAVFMQKVMDAIESLKKKGLMEPTAFEIETAIAFLYFYQKQCDIVILETGLGGTYDATNIIEKPLCSVITSISMDHMAFLGDTIEEIAKNKAGIIKKNCAVISASQKEEVIEVLEKKAELLNSCLIQAQIVKNIKFTKERTYMDYVSISQNKFTNIETSMLGTFQTKNIATAIETILYLRTIGFYIDVKDIYSGIKLAKWHGRFEKICDCPEIYFDGGHNPGAARELKETLQLYFTNRKIIFIIGVLGDKDYNQVLSITGRIANKIYTVTPQNKRALDGKILCECARKYNPSVEYASSFLKALESAKKDASNDGVIFVYGSLSFLKDIKQLV